MITYMIAPGKIWGKPGKNFENAGKTWQAKIRPRHFCAEVKYDMDFDIYQTDVGL